jgi:ElaB/YqjD/DUF883 family membrane-anchored ribosome-binding protein
MNTTVETIASSIHGIKAVQQSKDKLVADVKIVVNDAQALLKEAVETSAEGIGAVPAYLEDRLSAVKGNFHRAKDAFGATAKQATAATDEYIRENPWKSFGFISAASILVSIAMVSACTMRKSKV